MRHKSVIELSSSESPFTVLRSHPYILVYNFLNRVSAYILSFLFLFCLYIGLTQRLKRLFVIA